MKVEPLCVVLLNYSNWPDTLECLESLARVDHPALCVVVVDCGSPDSSLTRIQAWAEEGVDARPATEVWRRLPETLVARPAKVENSSLDTVSSSPESLPDFRDALSLVSSPRRLGFAAGCNVGLRLALRDPRVEYFWLLNNDTVTAPDAPRRLLARARASGPLLGALGTVIAEYRRPERIQILGGGRVRRASAEPYFPGQGHPIAAAPELAEHLQLDYVSGASLLLTRSALDRVGFLDESMHLYWEDTDWGTRARAVGLELAVCPDAVVWHKGHSSTGGINRYTQFHNFRSAALYLRRHRRLWPLPLLTRLAKTVARETTRGRPREAAAALAGTWAGSRLRQGDVGKGSSDA